MLFRFDVQDSFAFQFCNIKLVSIPCFELFEQQNIEYRNIILPSNKLKISVEAGSTLGWYKYANHCIGIDTFGASGKGEDLLKYFGLDVESIYSQILRIMSCN